MNGLESGEMEENVRVSEKDLANVAMRSVSSAGDMSLSRAATRVPVVDESLIVQEWKRKQMMDRI